jgi:glycosyltransferase involved in cell wall biosynthesis
MSQPTSQRGVVIVPTYNEGHNIRSLIAAVLATDPRLDLLIVDDNSPDGTGNTVEEIAKEQPRVHLLRRPGKMGLGTAYRDGFRWALAKDYELIFEMDADFSHSPNHLPEFLAAAERADFVLGSRYLDGKDKPAGAIGEGGTIPFMGMLGKAFPDAQFLITGVLGPKSNAHGPNEFLHVPYAKRLTACVARVLVAHAQR